MKYQICQKYETLVSGQEYGGKVRSGIYPVGEAHESIEKALAALLALKARTEVILPVGKEEAAAMTASLLVEEEGRSTFSETEYGGYVIQPLDDDGRKGLIGKPRNRSSQARKRC